MRAQRDLEAAAECRAMDCGDDGFARILHGVLNFGQRGAARVAAEFGDVGTRDEGATCTDEDDRTCRRIRARGLDSVPNSIPDVG